MRYLPWFLWAMVFLAAAVVIRQRMNQPQPGAGDNRQAVQTVELVPAESGAVLVDVPWKHLPDVPPFSLVNQLGQPVPSSSLDGQVYAIYFFFSTCPSICRDLNRQIENLNQRMSSDEIRFVGISVDPTVDQPEVLARYAEDFGAVAPRWQMLTGPLHRVRELGEHGLRVTIAKEIHTDNILLVDRWGRYRDRFRWDDPSETKRFVETARQLITEQAVPLDSTVRTRNALAAARPEDWSTVPWLRDFELTKADGKPLYSRDLTGQVWVGSFFFSRCATVCPRQNQYLAGLMERTKELDFPLLSLTTDPEYDTPEVLRQYAADLGADPARWQFLTGSERLTRRVAAEFFRAEAGPEHHSSRLFVVDRWHRVRGSFDWEQPEQEAAMLQLIRELQQETAPRSLPAPSAPLSAGDDS